MTENGLGWTRPSVGVHPSLCQSGGRSAVVEGVGSLSYSGFRIGSSVTVGGPICLWFKGDACVSSQVFLLEVCTSCTGVPSVFWCPSSLFVTNTLLTPSEGRPPRGSPELSRLGVVNGRPRHLPSLSPSLFLTLVLFYIYFFYPFRKGSFKR